LLRPVTSSFSITVRREIRLTVEFTRLTSKSTQPV
jgi:hypothetical protein